MIVLLTYDHPHRKTQDVAMRLYTKGHRFHVVGVPWVDRRPRRMVFAHRPAEMTWPCEPWGDPIDFFRHMDVPYEVVPKGFLFEKLLDLDPKLVVVGGAGILPVEIVNGFVVLNSHPGLLPQYRGLDALKWAIHNGGEVGVTSHVVDSDCDLGWRVSEARVPVYSNDSLHSFAMRQYEWELALFPPAVEFLLTKADPRSSLQRIMAFGTEPTKRMGRRLERELPAAFERFKEKYAHDTEDCALSLGR